jgi:hypothetical protein
MAAIIPFPARNAAPQKAQDRCLALVKQWAHDEATRYDHPAEQQDVPQDDLGRRLTAIEAKLDTLLASGKRRMQ